MGTLTNNLNLYKTDMQTGGDDEFDFDRDLNQNFDKIDARFTATDIVISPLNWQGNAAPYTQTINVSGMTANINPHAALIYSSDYETAQNERVEMSKIYNGISGAGTITFYATSPTGIELNLRVKKL